MLDQLRGHDLIRGDTTPERSLQSPPLGLLDTQDISVYRLDGLNSLQSRYNSIISTFPVSMRFQRLNLTKSLNAWESRSQGAVAKITFHVSNISHVVNAYDVSNVARLLLQDRLASSQAFAREPLLPWSVHVCVL
jgi:hypothetical protein